MALSATNLVRLLQRNSQQKIKLVYIIARASHPGATQPPGPCRCKGPGGWTKDPDPTSHPGTTQPTDPCCCKGLGGWAKDPEVG